MAPRPGAEDAPPAPSPHSVGLTSRAGLVLREEPAQSSLAWAGPARGWASLLGHCVTPLIQAGMAASLTLGVTPLALHIHTRAV